MWGCSSQEAEFYKLNLYVKTFKSLYFEGFWIPKCCILNIKYAVSFKILIAQWLAEQFF